MLLCLIANYTIHSVLAGEPVMQRAFSNWASHRARRLVTRPTHTPKHPHN